MAGDFPRLPQKCTSAFASLCRLVLDELGADGTLGPLMAETVLAQWALESGYGVSRLALEHNNYAGMKWRDGMEPWATPVPFVAHDGRASYCHFANNGQFVHGYFHRLDLIPAYARWDDAAQNGGDAFITHIGPAWLGLGPDAGDRYIKKVQSVRRSMWPLLKAA